MTDPKALAHRFFQISDERPISKPLLKREDDRKILESLLAEALEERYLRGMTDGAKQVTKEYEQGYSKALEHAMQVCESECFCENKCRLPNDYHDIECNACTCADAIRALKGGL